ncbi:hypothetical protein IY145_18020 [Methylosinus sp. H3A]|uniref:hypothetical protein n=1 Tax=Methylosinus sp. H3A TaxID=2785786 RepID=UPI0018C257DE|nr:hypothetical protein [Methylosinus sp. H3A]MBG0811252.1 hypothetical protein [Methylosinus sp. H3A]
MTSKIEQRKLTASELPSLVDDEDSRIAHFTGFLAAAARQMSFACEASIYAVVFQRFVAIAYKKDEPPMEGARTFREQKAASSARAPCSR